MVIRHRAWPHKHSDQHPALMWCFVPLPFSIFPYLFLPDPNFSLHFPTFGPSPKHPTVVLHISTILLKHPLPSFWEFHKAPHIYHKKCIYSHESHGNLVPPSYQLQSYGWASSRWRFSLSVSGPSISGLGVLIFNIVPVISWLLRFMYLLITFPVSWVFLLLSKLLIK